MQYYKYDEKYTNSVRQTLDVGNYGNSVEKYLYKTDASTGVNTFIVSVDLDGNDLSSFIKLQRVDLEPITKEEWTLFTSESDDYMAQKAMKRATRSNIVSVATVSYKGYTFDADEAAMGRMCNVLAVYNFKYNRLIANGTIASKAFEVYKEIIPWRDAWNEDRILTVEELGYLLQLAMTRFATLWLNN